MLNITNNDKTSKEYRIQKAMQYPNVLLAELCRKDFHFFFTFFWDELGSGESLVDAWHIQYLCKELQTIAERIGRGEKKLYDLIINIPPGTSKTTIIMKAYPVWCWIIGIGLG